MVLQRHSDVCLTVMIDDHAFEMNTHGEKRAFGCMLLQCYILIVMYLPLNMAYLPQIWTWLRKYLR